MTVELLGIPKEEAKVEAVDGALAIQGARKLVNSRGDFAWLQHEAEDELFLGLQGSFRMDYKDDSGAEKALEIGGGEFVIVPRGPVHRPAAPEEVHVMLFEPAGTLNTGNVRGARTVDNLQRI